jgi:glycosyltransferase involved in cell wall biosynthesis
VAEHTRVQALGDAAIALAERDQDRKTRGSKRESAVWDSRWDMVAACASEASASLSTDEPGPKETSETGSRHRPSPRVVLLSPSWPPDPGGGGIQLATLAERLAARGTALRVFVATTPASPEPLRVPGVGVVGLRVPDSSLLRQRALGLRAAAWLLGRSDWDLLHVSGFFLFAVPAVAAARLRRRPSIVKVTELRPGHTFRGSSVVSSVQQATLRRADRIVALSAGIHEALCAAGVPETHIARIPNGVDVTRFHPRSPADPERAALRRELGLPSSGTLLLCCGVVIRRKNAVAVVRAAARMRSRPLVVALVGPSMGERDYERELDAAIAALPDGVQVVRTGPLPREQMAKILRAADLLAHASHFEGMPNVLLEALASGLPCVATSIPGSVDVLQRGGGLLVPPEDEFALANALDALATDAARRIAAGAEARRIACEDFSLEAVADRYQALYRELLTG